eukprot:4355140-Pyramimonas_sp.AAC.1
MSSVGAAAVAPMEEATAFNIPIADEPAPGSASSSKPFAGPRLKKSIPMPLAALNAALNCPARDDQSGAMHVAMRRRKAGAPGYSSFLSAD